MDKYQVERLLKNNFYIGTIQEIKHPCKQTCNDIWSKEIILVKDDKAINMGELDKWQITADIDCESVRLDNIFEICENLALLGTEYEKRVLGDRNPDNCTCYMLSEWQFLVNEVGGIINKGKVTLVKYAKILEDME